MSNLLIKDQAGFHVEKGAVFEAGLRSSLDAGTDNLSFKHWDGLEQSATADTLWLEPRTRTSGITAGIAARIAGAAFAGGAKGRRDSGKAGKRVREINGKVSKSIISYVQWLHGIERRLG